ncbi:MAG TPA: type IV pilus biogenesis/stability protein PilW [Lamprocystis sp. (in: g-proteobacteria)]|nr:type IV pilus biogenesis/stability protein PilW [Lamprocystis sp. (in: g-proteobacteria)]
MLRLLALGGLCLVLAACGHRATREAKDSMTLDAQNSPGDLYVAMAAEYYRLGNLDDALRRAEQAIKEDKDNPRAYYIIAVIYQKMGETARAEENFKRSLELSPKNPDILNAYGTFYCSQRRYAEAQAQFAKAIENPLYANPWMSMTNAGTCAATAGHSAQAEAHFRKALAANPRFGPALFKMAEIEFRRGNAKVAKDYLDRYFQANAPEPQVLLLAIRTERKLGNAKASATYEQVLRKNFPDATDTQDL